MRGSNLIIFIHIFQYNKSLFFFNRNIMSCVIVYAKYFQYNKSLFFLIGILWAMLLFTQSIGKKAKNYSKNVFGLWNVLNKFKYFEVNFIVWIIIWRIYEMMEIWSILFKSDLENFKFLHCYNFSNFAFLSSNFPKFSIWPQ